jgi:hypothetical protein
MDNRILIFIVFIAILYFMSHKIESLAIGGRGYWSNSPHYIDRYHTIDDPYLVNLKRNRHHGRHHGYHGYHGHHGHHGRHRYHYYDRYPHDSRHFKEHFYRNYW